MVFEEGTLWFYGSMSVAASRSPRRTEIQALRAVAVLLVIGYHFWPGAFRAGFIGVDIFFVISGFLITAQLVRELKATGRISFSSFYARRARRILPAALTVVAACLIATFVVSSPALWSEQLRHVIAATLFFENWALAAQSVDYLAASHAATPVQHYWSLSVEEQFYVFWPALLAAVSWIAGRLTPGRRSGALLAALVVVVVVSFVFSVVTSFTDPAPAFFNTGVRVWEFGAGALLACLGAAKADRRGVRISAGLLGWVLIVASVVVLDESFAFPGFVALGAVIGTALVIWAGVSPRSRVAARVFDSFVVRWVAELSFAAYLWHWPLVVFARQIFGDDLSHALRLILLALTFALALATTVLIERPIRYGALARKRVRLTAAFAAVLTLAVAVPAGASLVVFESAVVAQVASAPSPVAGACVGAEARDPQRTCTDGPYLSLVPNPLLPHDDVSVLHGMGCAVKHSDPGIKSCEFGDVQSDVKVALVGDSHAMKMWPAIKRLAEENGWHLVTFLRGGCMYSLEPSKSAVCDDWRGTVSERLDEEGPWDAVFTTTTLGFRGDSVTAVAGLHQAWTPLTDEGAQVIVIADNPRLPDSRRKCIVDNIDDVSVCDVPRADVELTDIQVLAAKNQHGVHVVDLTPFYCDATTCVVSAGGVLLYLDATHLNDEYTVTLAPYIAEQVAVFAPQLFASRK